MSLRYFAVSTLLVAAIALIIEMAGVLALPDITAAMARSQRRGDIELRNVDLERWTRIALLGDIIATLLALAFIVAAVGLLRRRRWARLLFLAASLGVLAFNAAACILHPDATGFLHIGYALALLAFGWWFLFHSPHAGTWRLRAGEPQLL